MAAENKESGTTFISDFSQEIWYQTYKYHTDDSVSDTHWRIAQDLASAEADPEKWANLFYEALSGFKVVPGGRISSNAGTNLHGATYINCFTPDAEVLTGRGPVPIADVKLGDKVLTHKGRWRPVVALMSRDYEGDVNRYDSVRISNQITSTPEHPFYQGNDEWKDSKDNNRLVFARNLEETHPSYAPKAISVDDYLDDAALALLVKNGGKLDIEQTIIGGQGAVRIARGTEINRSILLTKEVAYAFGRYLGDGSSFKQFKKSAFTKTGFNIAFNTNEEEAMLKVKEALEEAFGVELNINRSDRNWQYIRKSAALIGTFFHVAFGDKAHTKRIPKFMWEASPDIQFEFLRGMWDADGTVTSKGEMKIALANEALIKELQTFAHMLGIPGTRRREKHQYENAKPIWILAFGDRELNFKLRSSLSKKYDDDRLVKRAGPSASVVKKVGDNLYVEPLRQTGHYNGKVYNISVEEDESYVVNNVIVHNCFVDGPVVTDKDSVEGIFNALTRAALTLKSEGGYGFCADFIRPRGAFIYGVGVETPGAVEMLRMWDTMSDVITKGSGKKKKKKEGKNKIRKGAMMVTMSCWHPDVLEFITAKQTSGQLSKFNMSVLCTDDFMSAVEKHLPWDLVYPDTTYEQYKEEWDGNISAWREKGYPVITYRTLDDANELWDLIMQSTYNRNEPGVLFVDRMNDLNNLKYVEHISATNPCVSERTWVMTSDGPRQVKDLIDIDKDRSANKVLVNGLEYAPKSNWFWKTGTKPLYRLETEEGFSLELTEDHKVMLSGGDWVPAKEIQPGQLIKLNNHRSNEAEWTGIIGNRDEGYLLGMLLGDGTFSNGHAVISVWEEEDDADASIRTRLEQCVEQFPHRSDFKGFVKAARKFGSPVTEWRMKLASLTHLANRYGICQGNKFLTPRIEQGSPAFYKGFLRGLFDADGSVQGSQQKGVSIRLAQSNKEMLEAVQRMLLRLGIVSSIYKRRDGGQKMMPDGKGGQKLYSYADQFELIISGEDLVRYRDLVGFEHPTKMHKLNGLIVNYKRTPNRTKFLCTFKSLEYIGEEDVYDITVEDIHAFDANGIVAHNCGEQVLPPGGVCLLGSLNLTQFVNEKRNDWDYEKLAKYIPIFVRMLDNVNDRTLVPLPEQRWNLQNKRRIGVGYLGYGSALYLMKVRYGSRKALSLTDRLARFVTNECYKASAMLASEKGAFPLYDEEEYLSSNFIAQALDRETIDLIRQCGARNSHLTSIQPTGNSSVYANNVSGGLEPVVSAEYFRTVIVPEPPEGLAVPQVNWEGRTFHIDGDTKWEWVKEGDESILLTKFNGEVYKFDRNRGLTRENLVEDYAVHVLKELEEWKAEADWAANIFNLTIREHVDTMKTFAKYIDSAMSKTINLPKDYPYEDFKSLYMDMFKSKVIKGGTTYREGTMTNVISTTSTSDAQEEPKGIVKHSAPKRPEELECDVHHLTVGGERWVVFIGLYEGVPYEAFAGLMENVHLGKKVKKGMIVKHARNKYGFINDDVEIKDINAAFDNATQSAITRMVSMSLRHGVDIKFIVTQLQKTGNGLNTFAKCLARTLKKYIDDGEDLPDVACHQCGSKTVVMMEGCNKCLTCGASACA